MKLQFNVKRNRDNFFFFLFEFNRSLIHLYIETVRLFNEITFESANRIIQTYCQIFVISLSDELTFFKHRLFYNTGMVTKGLMAPKRKRLKCE